MIELLLLISTTFLYLMFLKVEYENHKLEKKIKELENEKN